MPDKKILYLGLVLFLNSFACLLLEIVLIKKLSFVFWGVNNFDFLVTLISLTLGFSLGSFLTIKKSYTATYSVPKAILIQECSIILIIFVMNLAFLQRSISFYISLVLSSFLTFGGLGFISTSLFKLAPKQKLGSLYFFDLVGAAIGSLSALLIIPKLGLVRSLLVVFLFLFFSFIIFTSFMKCKNGFIFKNKKILSILFFILFVFLFYFSSSVESRFLDIGKCSKNSESILFSGWSPVQFVQIGSENGYYFCYNGMSVTKIFIPKTVSIKTAKWPVQILYTQLQPKSVLALGIGGGFNDIYFAYLTRIEADKQGLDMASDITGVDVDPLVVNLLKGKFSSLNDNLYNQENISIVADDASHFIKHTSKNYDLIFFSFIRDFINFKSFIRSENYLYTLETLEGAFDKLSENGTIAIALEPFQNPVTMCDSRCERLIATSKKILQKKGFGEDWVNHVQIISDGGAALILLSKNQLKSFDLSQIINNVPVPNSEGKIPKVSEVPKDRLQALSSVYGPVTNDRPFWYNFPINNIPRFLRQGLLFFIILLIIYSFWVYFFTKNAKDNSLFFLFFACIGMSFMAIEMMYIQKAVVFTKSIVYGSAIFLSIFLFSCGLGSLIADKLKKKLLILLILPFYNLLCEELFSSLDNLNSDLLVRGTVLSLLIFPLGFLLGFFFPKGLFFNANQKQGVDLSHLYIFDMLGSLGGLFFAFVVPIMIGYSLSIKILSFFFVIQIVLLLLIKRKVKMK